LRSVVVCAVLGHERRVSTTVRAERPKVSRARLGLSASTALIFAATLFPFRLRFDRAHLLEKMREIEWELYYTDRPGHVSIDRDLIQNLVLFAPFGGCLALAARTPRPKRDVLSALGLGTMLSATVELLQLLTESRVTQLADVWRNALGAALAALVVSSWRAWTSSPSP
jgi:glycopeptide antibiotics resistance protein